ncbi:MULTISPECIES: DUF6507 family protein [Nocardiopsis]|uniref:PE domain-containing protein n=1 Tax=Nocardiopsis dassonvillei (strain ATCC 23218 / DSM 43111 / CIP 107115 / JCM 7437 / KCTC 9190 / NBRC 14626 / NCTC 10488 / NRRL B-5397 / IMRU 509) TaxID=446468 RepID=D7B8C2_NOCDD|nr:MULTISPECIES: DUF6507 family protein [Nocardiopsis]ADH70430.1 conserved hypothetical protein [Nocardiopsis dassonvillei subsp. dassonvillei DSM 43111]ASU56563.1 hypothetical protein CGQ36_02940 [Nocardiopsis dassonvillei]NKY77060.1 hypothetical protein [Nocardiopsis dassonvillei]VEI91339.1 Uncharacterised protein [Nocardiopsis dassonvillei]
MSGWNIQPAEVGAVLTSVAGYIGEEGGSDGLVGAMTSAENLITAINEEANSTPVSVALGEFAEHNFGLMGDMAGLAVSAVTNTSTAVTHYFNGNMEMAAEAQENAGVIPEPEPPRQYGPHAPV